MSSIAFGRREKRDAIDAASVLGNEPFQLILTFPESLTSSFKLRRLVAVPGSRRSARRSFLYVCQWVTKQSTSAVVVAGPTARGHRFSFTVKESLNLAVSTFKKSTRVLRQTGQGPNTESYEKDMNDVKFYFQLYTNSRANGFYNFHAKIPLHTDTAVTYFASRPRDRS